MSNLQKIDRRTLLAVKRAKRAITRRYRDNIALVLIGSVVDGTNHEGSDIDIVWIKRRKVHYRNHFDIEERLNSDNKYPRVQLVTFTKRQVLWHFKHSSTMAHSIRNGIVIYGKRKEFVSKMMMRKLKQPTREWMNYWFQHWLRRYNWSLESIESEREFHRRFCRRKCSCTYMDDIARVTVNFAILFLELKGIIPLSKSQIRNAIRQWMDNETMKGMNLALRFAGRDEWLKLKQIKEILKPSKWLKRRLVRQLDTTPIAKKP